MAAGMVVWFGGVSGAVVKREEILLRIITEN